MRVVGYVHGRGHRRAERERGLFAELSRVDCENPLLAECRDCGRPDVWACSCHRSSKCRPCAARYRRRLARIAESGCQRREGYLYLLTCTAPGWREHVDRRTGETCPCTPPGGIDLARWNASHSRRWNHLRTRLRQAVPALEFLRGIEVQARGALHDHALLWSPVPLRPERMREFAVAAGFGHSVDLAPLEAGSGAAARYVTKRVAGYVTKACDSRDAVPWWGEYVDRRTGEIREGRVTAPYRTWSSSRGWGLTMAGVRAICREHARARAHELHSSLLQELCSALDAEVLPVAQSPP
jgi:hypothetical protein